MKNHYLLMAGAWLLAGCDARIDTTSPQEYTSSVEAMVEGMSEEKKSELKSALIAIAFDTWDPANSFVSNTDPTSPLFAIAGDKIDGKTAEEVIRLGYETRLTALDKEIAVAAADIQKIREERKKHAAIFDNIKILAPRYSVDHSNEFMAQPLLSFLVTNGSSIPLKRLFFHGVLSTPGRAVPWVSEDFNYDFPGGIEPGETKSLDLAPNSFGEWKPVPDYSERPDLKLAITVVNVEDANGQELLKGDPGDAKDKALEIADKQKQRAELAAKLKQL